MRIGGRCYPTDDHDDDVDDDDDQTAVGAAAAPANHNYSTHSVTIWASSELDLTNWGLMPGN